MPFGRLKLCCWCPSVRLFGAGRLKLCSCCSLVRLFVPLGEPKTILLVGFCKYVNCSRWLLMPVLVSKAVTTYSLNVNLCSARIRLDGLNGHLNRNETINVANARTTTRCPIVVSWITDTGSKGYPLLRFGMGREGG